MSYLKDVNGVAKDAVKLHPVGWWYWWVQLPNLLVVCLGGGRRLLVQAAQGIGPCKSASNHPGFDGCTLNAKGPPLTSTNSVSG